MDPLSGIASIIAVLQLTQTVGRALKDLFWRAKHARSDIACLYSAVTSLEQTLKALQNLPGIGPPCQLPDHLLGALHQSKGELELIQQKLENKHVGRKGDALRALQWPFQKEPVMELVYALETHKATLNLAISIESLISDTQQHEIVKAIQRDITSANEDTNRKKVVDWLASADPSIEHNMAREKHEATTGSWLIDSTEFTSWVESRKSFLWLHGGAGSGKSILCSTAIEHVSAQCTREPGTAIAYWYFTFTDTNKQSISNCLKSLIRQICSRRTDTPLQLLTAWAGHANGSLQPSIITLRSLLKEVADGFGDIFLVLDALDECPRTNNQRKILLDTILEMVSFDIDSLHILATSRKEPDIEKALHDLTESQKCIPVGVVGERVQRDIKLFITEQLRMPEFSDWGSNIKAEVSEELQKQASFMFRLVALQLEVLSKHSIPAKIREAVRRLPKTLDAFYERILLEIDDEHQNYIFIALQWIAYAARPVYLDELAEAVLVGPSPDFVLQKDDRFPEPSNVLKMFPAGLITNTTITGADFINPDITGSYMDITDMDIYFNGSRTRVQLAHFSVKEYLSSPRISSSPACQYAISERLADSTIAQICFRYFLHFDRIDNFTLQGIKNGTSSTSLYSTGYHLLEYACTYWPYHVRRLGNESDEQLDRLILRLFAGNEHLSPLSRLSVYLSLLTIPTASWNYLKTISRSSEPLKILYVKRSKPRPLYIGASLGLTRIVKLLIESGANVQDEESSREIFDNESNDTFFVLSLSPFGCTSSLGFPIIGAAAGGHIDVMQILLDAGADVNASGGIYGTALQAAAMWNIEIVKFLVQEGADVNASGGHYGTALQVAASMGNIEIVKFLVQKGADVNASGRIYGTALQAAALMGNIEIVKFLVQKGADVNASGESYGSALQDAASMGNIEIVKFLVQEGADVNASGGHYGTALQDAASMSISRSLNSWCKKARI